jgi:hypothetical protein
MFIIFIGWLTIFLIPNIFSVKTSNQKLNETVYTISGGSRDQVEEFQEMLARHFPDWDKRLSVEKEQAIIYNKAIKKLKANKNFNPLLENTEKGLTDEEKFSLDYFYGRGICEKLQDPKTSPNIYDTRQTFLKKMENQEMRQKFLESYNQRNPIKEN